MADNPIKYSDLVIDDGAIDQLIKKIKLLEKTFLASQKTFQKEIAKTKMQDLTANSVEAAVATLAGTALSMGITVDNNA